MLVTLPHILHRTCVQGYVGLQPLLDRVNYYLGRPMGPGRTFRGARN